MDTPRELISPEQSQVLVLALSLLCAAIGGAIGWRRGGSKAAAFAFAVGLAVLPLWKAHEWATRFDASSGYFGLESVWVLLGECVVFVVLGVLIGRAWGHLTENPRSST